MSGRQRARLQTRLEQLKKQHSWGDLTDPLDWRVLRRCEDNLNPKARRQRLKVDSSVSQPLRLTNPQRFAGVAGGLRVKPGARRDPVGPARNFHRDTGGGF